jgi:hypothetical protein
LSNSTSTGRAWMSWPTDSNRICCPDPGTSTAAARRELGRPAISLRTCYRPIREQARWATPRLIAKGDPDHDTTCTSIRDQIAALPTGAVVLAEGETHLDLLARVRACWMTHGQRRRILTPGSDLRRPSSAPSTWSPAPSTTTSRTQRCLCRVLLLPRPTPDRPPERLGRGGNLRQRQHPPQRHQPPLARNTWIWP